MRRPIVLSALALALLRPQYAPGTHTLTASCTRALGGTFAGHRMTTGVGRTLGSLSHGRTQRPLRSPLRRLLPDQGRALVKLVRGVRLLEAVPTVVEGS